MTKVCSLQTDNAATLQWTLSILLTEHGEVDLVPTQSLHSHVLECDTGRSSAHCQRETETPILSQTL